MTDTIITLRDDSPSLPSLPYQMLDSNYTPEDSHQDHHWSAVTDTALPSYDSFMRVIRR